MKTHWQPSSAAMDSVFFVLMRSHWKAGTLIALSAVSILCLLLFHDELWLRYHLGMNGWYARNANN
jgi:hypothetical protein